MKEIKFIMNYVKGKKYVFGIMILCVLIYSFGLLLCPLIISYVLDHVIDGLVIHDPMTQLIDLCLGGSVFVQQHLWIAALAIIVVYSVVAITVYTKGVCNGIVSEMFSKNLRDNVYNHLQTLSFSYHKNKESGDLIQRATSDIDQIRRCLATQLSEMFYSIFTSVIAVSILLSLNVTLTLISFFVLPILFVSSYMFFKKSKKIFLDCDLAESKLTSIIQENLAGVRVVKAFNKEIQEIDKFEVANSAYQEKLYQLMHTMTIFWSATDILGLLQILIMLVAGIPFVHNGFISVGQYFVFLSYVSFVIWPLRQLGRILADMGKLSVSIHRIEEILLEQVEDLECGLKPEINGDIIFNNVCFSYEDSDLKTLKNINFHIKPKQTVAIMGPTGSGKSSLVSLLSRLYDYEGSILIDGIELKHIAKGWARKNIGIVLQEPFLFSKTIYDNLALTSKSLHKSSIYEAAKIASIHDVIVSFNEGYETEVGEKGVTLSGGQKQRIAIARTLVNKSPIIIFDDSLSALDSNTDAKIQESLKGMEHKATMLIVTHRVNSAIKADQIIVLEEGKIAQIGNHESLMQEKGLYKEIYELQMGGNYE